MASPTHRTQITLTGPQYERLRREAERTGASLSELIRRAIDTTYGRDMTLDERLRAIDATAGAWNDEHRDGGVDGRRAASR